MCPTTSSVFARAEACVRQSRRLSGSSSAKLSSSKTRSAFWTSVLAMNTRLRSPCESCQPVSPTR